MNNPTVSVLIPTYNYARFLPEAIESVLFQDFQDFELIIADDSSADNTDEICRKYAELDTRIRFVRHEKNLGMVENWNWCLRAARGKHIKFLLADDKFAQPYTLRRLVDAMELPGVSLVTSSRNLMDETSAVTGLWNPLGAQDSILSGKKLIARCLGSDLNMIGEPTAVLFRADDAARGFDPEYRQLVDLEMWVHLLQHGELAYISDSLCCFRQHSRQQTVTNRELGAHWYEMVSLCKRYLGGSVKKAALFRQMYSLNKRKPELVGLADEIRGEFTPAEYLFFFAQFKTRRFFKRLCRSFLRHGIGMGHEKKI